MWTISGRQSLFAWHVSSKTEEKCVITLFIQKLSKTLWSNFNHIKLNAIHLETKTVLWDPTLKENMKIMQCEGQTPGQLSNMKWKEKKNVPMSSHLLDTPHNKSLQDVLLSNMRKLWKCAWVIFY